MENYDKLCGRIVVDYRLDEDGRLVSLILKDGIEVHAAGLYVDDCSYFEVIEY